MQQVERRRLFQNGSGRRAVWGRWLVEGRRRRHDGQRRGTHGRRRGCCGPDFCCGRWFQGCGFAFWRGGLGFTFVFVYFGLIQGKKVGFPLFFCLYQINPSTEGGNVFCLFRSNPRKKGAVFRFCLFWINPRHQGEMSFVFVYFALIQGMKLGLSFFPR